MLDEISDIIMKEIILYSLSRLEPTILNGRNVTISSSYENFTLETYTEFNVYDFNDDFYNCFATTWSCIEHNFFNHHKPRFCFTRYGQNVLIDDEVDL